jgi:putative transposase
MLKSLSAVSLGEPCCVQQTEGMPNRHYATDLTDAAWSLITPLLLAAQPGGRPRTTDIRALVNAIFYCSEPAASGDYSRASSRCGQPCTTTFRSWKNTGVWTCLQRRIYEQAR